MSVAKLVEDAQAIWWAGVRAVQGQALVAQAVDFHRSGIRVRDDHFPLEPGARIAVVGAGKAVVGMARGLESRLDADLQRRFQLRGWVNAPDQPLTAPRWIHVHPARSLGSNEPTPQGVEGVRAMLQIVEEMREEDLVLCLLTGGGSALMPLPADGVTLRDKLEITRRMSAGGADIWALNTVRKAISGIKGGKLAARCKAGRLVTLLISDVLGDCLNTIASGPTMPESLQADVALRLLETYAGPRYALPISVVRRLEEEISSHGHVTSMSGQLNEHWPQLSHYVLGNNEAACRAAENSAKQLGYVLASTPLVFREGVADQIGSELLHFALESASTGQACATISGGEPVVTLAPKSKRGRGGRNQQLALAALASNVSTPSTACVASTVGEWPDNVVFLSAGTDGEDGPTDAAGAIVTKEVAQKARDLGLNARDYLARNDAYSFFQQCGGLFMSGPTETNVCDLRVVLSDPAP